MKKERKADKFIPKPIFPGGPRKMSAFIYKNLKYPADDIPKQIKGTVRIKIEIDYNGNVIGSQIMSGLSSSCDHEAKRIVNLLKFEFSHKFRKGKIRYHKTLNIKFNPPPILKNPTTRIKYNITASKKTNKSISKNKPQTIYSYSIKI